MALLELTQYPNPVLVQKASLVTDIESPSIQTLIDNMIETLHSLPGIGLAAPQVGQSLRLFVFNLSAQEGEITPYKGPHVVINPEILKLTGENLSDEGCLSVTGFREGVKRASFALLKGFDRTGKEIELAGEGLTARLFQHEVDHLNGMLMIHRLSSLKKDIFYRWFKKKEK
jgi:peptide deformylase